ncbi:amidohydrolase family protein [Nocardia vinacea]|uniref:Amidohydrolase family protein n=1 Tax=Nocardia vinacea TaxID=96468 RepID=A0ABZ1YWD7_9NOCA|nr:amidohydrolase family protein [Nocardia vinacea]
MLIRDAEVFGAGRMDVRIHGGVITECATGLVRLPGEDEIYAGGGWLLPGLHDHHIHLRSLAATYESVPLGPPHVRTATEFAARLQEADRKLLPGKWIRGTGYHESVAGPLDRAVLDRMLPHRPVRVQHRTGVLWQLNSMACELVGLDSNDAPGVERDETGRPTGRLRRMDSWMGERVDSRTTDLAAVSAAAAAMGITGFTDATPGLAQADVDQLAETVETGRIVQRVHCMAPPEVSQPDGARFTLGPTKIVLDDFDLPPFDEFADRLRAIHAASRTVAVHCVTRVQFILTMAALDLAGVRAGDRIEHGAVIPHESLDWLRRQRVSVVTQPHFVVERAEQYRDEVPAADLPDLWRLRSLVDAGVGVAAGSDAPFGAPDPWSVVRAAVHRPAEFHAAEAVSVPKALSLFFGAPDSPAAARWITPGAVADLTLLSVPPDEAAHQLDAGIVAATIVAGDLVYSRQ